MHYPNVTPTSREELLLQLDNSRSAVSLAMATIREMKYNQTVETGHILLRLAMIQQEVNDVLDSVNSEESKRPNRLPIETVISELTLM
jgi:hypothetical protein